MKKRLVLMSFLTAVLLFSACNKPVEEPAFPTAPGNLSPEIPPTETEPSVDLPPTETPNILVIDPLDTDSVAFDFTVDICRAEWSTNASQLPCPGHLEDAEDGYMETADHGILEGMISVEAPLLIGIPGKGYPVGLGLFGKYPPFTVYPGDVFRATIACQGGAECDLDFSLEYFDAQGVYHSSANQWLHKVGDGPEEIEADLNALAGQTVEFLIVMRSREELENQWGVWIQPRIFRDPNAQPLPTSEILTTSTPDPSDKTPGVISGMVDMSSAPPYLKDSMSGGSSPVAVVFYNLSDGTYWWIHTSLTGHPYFQMTITPGDYQVVAYAPGVGDMPYVAGGYTGQNPSCGKNLKTITMTPNGRLENIVVADWNWVCGGTASRQPKPGGVPLP